MPLALLKVRPSALKSFLPGPRPISRIDSHPRPAIPPLVYRRTQLLSPRFFASGEIPSIREKLPDPKRTPFRFREFDLEGKVFVVTGGGRGLGLALAEALVEAGGEGG